MGYNDVALLAGGLKGWGELLSDVNSPSKAFGGLVENRAGTPSLAAVEVNALLYSGKPAIVNCAGRTRSIIGTQSLVNSSIRNPVFALRNGTIGWTLAGLTLEQGQSRQYGHVSHRSSACGASGPNAWRISGC